MQAIPAKPIPLQPPKPYARRKLERTKSLESVLDKEANEYTYIDPHVRQAAPTLPRPRPPRPPPPRKLYSVSPNKPAITQRTLLSSSEQIRKSMIHLGQRNSAPLTPTPKERSRWRKQ